MLVNALCKSPFITVRSDSGVEILRFVGARTSVKETGDINGWVTYEPSGNIEYIFTNEGCNYGIS